MLKSMTGYGRGEGTVNGRHIVFEVKSVNHKYFECNARITRGCLFLEERLKAYLQERMARGKIDVFLQVENLESAGTQVEVNHALAGAYVSPCQGMVHLHLGAGAFQVFHLQEHVYFAPGHSFLQIGFQTLLQKQTAPGYAGVALEIFVVHAFHLEHNVPPVYCALAAPVSCHTFQHTKNHPCPNIPARVPWPGMYILSCLGENIPL